jgi:hypothetical protein
LKKSFDTRKFHVKSFVFLEGKPATSFFFQTSDGLALDGNFSSLGDTIVSLDSPRISSPTGKVSFQDSSIDKPGKGDPTRRRNHGDPSKDAKTSRSNFLFANEFKLTKAYDLISFLSLKEPTHY